MINRISLKNFRSYSSATFDFTNKTNIIIGKNGVGKTNILEAINILATGSSFRSSDKDVIQYEKKQTKITGTFDEKNREVIIHEDKSKYFNIQNTKIKRISFAQKIPIVLFEPEFMQILSKGPDKRRDYFDTILSKIHPNYQAILNKYKRSLSQRNNLLKKQTFSKDEIFVWNIKISEIGGQIANFRMDLINEINKTISEIYSQIAGSESKIEINYITNINKQNYTDSLLKNLEKNIETDKLTGFTSFGTHRDDFYFSINNKDASTSASRGEGRTILLALKIIETKLVEQARGTPPILLLDDVFSELDTDRQGKLVDFLYNNQVIITTTTITPLMKGVSGEIIEL